MERRITKHRVSGQYLVTLGKHSSACLTWMNCSRDQLIDGLEALHELLEQERFIPFFRTGRLTKEQILITRLDPNDEDEISVDFPDLTGKEG